MKKILKSFLACTLSLLMCLGSVAFAGAEEAVGIAVSATEDTTILTNDFTTLSGGSENFDNSGNYGFCQGAYAETVIDVAEEGYYKMSVNSLIRTGKTISFSVYLDGEFEEKFTLWGDGTAYDYEVCDLHLKKGQQTLKIAFDCSTGSYHYLPSITLSKKAVASKSIWKNAVDVSDTAAYTQIAHNMYYTSAKAPIGYTINVPEGGAGLYQMYIQTARVDADITSYDVTVNGEAVMTSKATIPQNNPQVNEVYAVEQKLSPMCYVTLKEGENTVIFTNNGAFTYFSRLKFDKANLDENAITLNATGATEISFADASLSNVGYVADNGNHYKFVENSSATVDVNVLKTGVYTMNVKALTRNGLTNTWNVYVDGNLYETYYTWFGSIWYEGEAIDIDFKTAGLHTIKIETPVANAYMDGFTLTKKANDYKAQWILGSTATGTGSVNYEKYQIDNGGNVQEYAEYKVNAETAGIYKITTQTTWNTIDLTSAVLSVNGAEANVVTIAGGERGSYGDQKITTDLGNVFLNAGENTIRITNKDLPNGQTLMITRVKVEKVGDATALSTTEPTAISLENAVLSNIETNHNGTGNYKYGNGAYTLSTVYVTTPGVYTMNVKVLTRDQHKNTWNVYVDDVLEGTFYTWLGLIWYEGEAIDIDFKTAGAHTIKVATPNANAYMNGFTLTKKATDYKAQWILGTAATGTGQNIHEKYEISNAGNVNQYAEFDVNVDSTGVYRITMQSTFNEVELTSAVLTVNGNEIGAVNVAGCVRGSYGDEQVITVLGDATLDAGSNKIKIINKDLPNGQKIRISRIKVEKISDAAMNNVKLHIRDYDKAYAPGNTADTSQLGQEGANPDNTLFRENDWAEYTVNIKKAGSYDFGLCFGAANAQKVAVYVDGSEKLNADYAGVSGSYAKTDVVLGKLNFAKEGTYTIKVAKVSGGFAYVSHLFLNYAGSVEKDVRMHMRSYTAAYAPANSADTSQLGQEGANPDNTLFRVGDWAEYDLEILAPGAYDFGICIGVASAQKINLYVNGVKKLDGTYAGGTDYTKVDTVLGSVNFFEAGTYKIKVEKVDGGFAYSSHIFFNYTGEATADVRMHIRDYAEAYASQNTADTTQLKQDGSNPDNTLLQVGNWAKYDIKVVEPGWYEYGLKLGVPGGQPQTIKVYIDDVEASVGGYTTSNAAGDYSTRVDGVFGKIYFAEAKNYTLKIEKTAGNFAYASHVFLNYIGELPATPVSSTETTEIAAKDYTLGFDKSKSTSVMTIEGGNVSFGQGDYVEYIIETEEAGLYKLAVTTGCGSTAFPTYDIYVNNAFQHRQIGSNKDWSIFEAANSYIKLEEGRNTVRIENVGHPDFYLCSLAFTFVGDYIAPTSADESLAAYVVSGVSGAKDELAFGVYAENSGIYRITLSARAMGDAKVNISDSEKLLAVVNLTASTKGADTVAFVELKEGYNAVKINKAGGTIVYSDVQIAEQTTADAETLATIVSDATNAKTTDELSAVIDDAEEALGVSFDALTDGIQYPEYVLIRLLGKEYINAAALLNSIYAAANEETSAPSLTTTLADGTLTVNAKTGIYEADGTLIVAVYEITTAGKRMKGVNYVPYTVGTDATLTVANCNENYAIEVFAFNDMQKLQPITVSNGVYANIYVAPNGSDEAAGTEDAPFLTLARAKEEVASLRGSMTGDIVVNLAPGYYELTETEVFDANHGGKGAYNVIYKGTGETQSVIGGGKKVTGWTDADGDGIYAASFTGADVRDLYVNGYPAKRARSEMLTATERNDKILTAEVGSYSFAKPAELVTVWINEWTNHYIPVEDLTKSGTTATITLSDAVNFNTGTPGINIYENADSTAAWCDWHYEYHKSFYLENALELLDEEGEFYYDKAAGMMYYKPYSEENLATADVYASQIDSLIEVSGADNKNKVTNIVFDNLSFRYSSWNNNEIIDIQATQYVSAYDGTVRTYSEIPSQITFNYANNVVIENCEFTCLGSNALALYDAVTNAKVSGNIFRDLSGGAMVIGSYTHEHESELGRTCSDIEISDNVIRRTSLVWRGMPSIAVYYEKDIDIVRNDIADVTYSGMSLGWGWGNTTARFGNFTVSNNRIHNVMQTLTDGAHIYTLGDMPGTVISNNYMTNSPDGRGGVYNDSGSANIDILSNVIDVYKNGTSYWWFQGVFKTHDLHAEGNFSHSKNDAQQRADAVNNTYVNNNNIKAAGSWDGAGNAEAQAIIDGAGLSNEYKALITKAALPSWRTNPLVTP